MCGWRVAVPVESLVLRHVRSADCSRCSWLTSALLFLIKQVPTALRCVASVRSVWHLSAFFGINCTVTACSGLVNLDDAHWPTGRHLVTNLCRLCCRYRIEFARYTLRSFALVQLSKIRDHDFATFAVLSEICLRLYDQVLSFLSITGSNAQLAKAPYVA